MAGVRGALSIIDQLAKLLGKNEPNMARAERLVREMPQATEVFAPSTLARALKNTPEGNLVGITPQEFRMLAVEPGNMLNPEQVEKYYQHLRTQGNYLPSMPFFAVEDVPDEFAYILGHDGRHRNRALGQLYGEDIPFPVKLERYLNSQRSPGRIESSTLAGEGNEDDFIELMNRPRFKQGGLAQCSCHEKAMRKGHK